MSSLGLNKDRSRRTAGLVRLLTVCLLMIGQAAAVAVLVMPHPATAQGFFDFFQTRRPQQQQQRRGFDWFNPGPSPGAEEPRAIDYSKAPPPKKPEAKQDPNAASVLVLGDSMADWLAYGLELAYADSPDVAVLRRHRANSGLIRTEVRSDPRGEYPDWPQTARDMIATQKPKFVLMMVGLNDRRQFRETAQVRAAAKPAAKPADDPAALELDRGAPDKPADAAAAPAETPAGGTKTLEFRTDAWSEAYIRRIDDTIAALKTSGVPVFWVGLPPMRGQKVAADVAFLNDLYRSRADKAGIIYIDIWDGFVDEDGRFAQSGPDFEGQTRRLRTGDGVFFTQAGARKLAHFAEREMQRWMSARATPAALPVPDEPKPEVKADPAAPVAVAPKFNGQMRPMAGPAVPLMARTLNDGEELLGANVRQAAIIPDVIANKVLVNGETLPAPAGRADDFAWPRRDVAPIGSDPLVAATELPMTPMLADRTVGGAAGQGGASPSKPEAQRLAAAAAAGDAKPVRRPPRQAFAENNHPFFYRPDARPDNRRQQGGFFNSLFGGGGFGGGGGGFGGGRW